MQLRYAAVAASILLMFGSVLGDFSEYGMLHAAAEASDAEVLDALAELAERRGLEVDLQLLGGTVWATVHGLASLLIDREAELAGASRPMRSLAAIGEDPERALRLVFGHLLGPD